MRWPEGFIAVDWGTTNRRGYLIDPDGRLIDEMEDDRGILAEAQMDRVAPVQQLEHRLQVVEAVRPPAGDPEEQIQLGRRGERGRPVHGSPQASTTSRTLASPLFANTRRGRGGCASSHSR